MADAITKITDVVVPTLFAQCIIERTATLSDFVKSGIIMPDEQFVNIANGGGQILNMPFWQDLSGNSQVLGDSTSIETKKITASKDIAVLHNRGDGWSTNDLAGILAGSDPVDAIEQLLAEYWSRDMQAMLISSLKGVFAAASMSGGLLDIHATSGPTSSANFLTGSTFVDAKQKLGDAKSKLRAIAMHSAVEAALLKLDLIDFIPDSEGKERISVFQQQRVVVDDSLPVTIDNGKNVYSSYLFGEGAFAMGVSTNDEPVDGGWGTWQFEYSRDAAAGVNKLFNRRRFILHPRGVKWTSASMAGQSPTNSELEDGTNWTRVFEQKNVRMVKIVHNID